MANISDMTDLERRAFLAYLRPGNVDQPSCATETTHDGLHYVVITNANGVLAAYRVRPSDGVLRRLKRWPAGIAY